MTKSKQKPLPIPVEYRLLVTYRINEQTKKRVVLVALRTVEEFSNFRYEIVVQDSIRDSVLLLDVHGLRVSQKTLPSAGPAIFRKEYPDLLGVSRIVVSKLDRELKSFAITVSKNDIAVVPAETGKYVEFVAREEEW
ncbi:MAG TPA: hypothetical protein VKS81_00525 [Bacteroidota bacterium]|nr:hypothetical protein [Bacteroidota bacterium]